MARTVVGLEITEESVRAVEVTATRKPILLAGGEVPLPPGAAKDSEVLDPDAVAVAIRQLWSRTGIKGRHVVLGIGSRRILVREYTTQAMRPDLLRQALPFQVQDLLPVPVNQAVLDFYPISQERDQVSGLLVAAVSETVEQLIATLAKAKLIVDSVDLVPFGLARAARVTGAAGETVAMVHLSDHTTYVVVAIDGIPRFVRIIPIDIPTPAVLAQREVPTEASLEELLETVPAQPAGMRSRSGARPTGEAEPAVADLAARVRSTLEFYNNRNHAQPISSVFVSGPGVTVPGVWPALLASIDARLHGLSANELITARKGQAPEGDLAFTLVSTIGVLLGGAY